MTSSCPPESTQLAFDLDDRPETHVYVASALTALGPGQRAAISHRCEIIDRTIIEASGAAGHPWQVHLPVLWSACRPPGSMMMKATRSMSMGL